MNKKIRRNTIDFAIDLGTSDSVIAYFNGKESKIIKNHSTGEDFTPSAVFIDGSGEIHIGKMAKDAIIKDPANAVSEFKLNMGFPIPFLFEKSNRKMFPEQLSAEILKDLKKSIYMETGENIEEIVITVPANSNPLKTKATKEAAELAGFKSVYLILEPVASAIAYGLLAKKEDNGIWMVYDLGGGTFDASLVKANGEEIEKLATSGEDNLGGKLFDWKIVDDYFTPKIRDDLGLNNFARDNPKYLQVFSILKNEAEKAKIELSDPNIDAYEANINNLIETEDISYDFKCNLTKEDLIDVMKPFLKTTFNHCYEILDERNLSVEDVEKIILVGGSTLSSIVRDSIQSEFNRPLEYSINPLTVVAEGASIYAGTIEKQFTEPQNNRFALILDYENIGFKDSIDINGKAFGLNRKFSFLDYSIEVINSKNGETVKKLDLDIDGNFKLDLPASDDYNEFLINLYDDKNNLVELDDKSANSIIYKKALNPGYPISSSSISLYLDEDSSLILKNNSNELFDLDFKIDEFSNNSQLEGNSIDSKIDYLKEYSKKFNSSTLLVNKGERIPITKKELFYTSKSIKKGDKDSFIRMSFYSGELILADYNTLLGEIIIDGSDLMDDLPKESDVELNVHINESNLISFEVFIPYLRQSFNNSFNFNNYSNYNNYLSNYDNLKAKYGEIIEKYNVLKVFALDNGNKELFNENESLDIVYENIEEIEEKEIISYLNVLIDMAKYDKIAIYPSLEYLNYLNDVLDECRFFLNISNIVIGDDMAIN
ncbi:MAG: Hsp70 family protein [Methanobrevibacter sp.]|nr:Hsp70 family protein [Methanobrevibacter sp.]